MKEISLYLLMKSSSAIILRLFDYLTSILTGILTAMLVYGVVSPAWSMPVAMIAGMGLGLVALMLMVISLGWVAGSFEIIMPGKLIAMIVGMGGGMGVTQASLTAVDLAAFGFFVGLVVAICFHSYDKSLFGEQI